MKPRENGFNFYCTSDYNTAHIKISFDGSSAHSSEIFVNKHEEEKKRSSIKHLDPSNTLRKAKKD